VDKAHLKTLLQSLLTPAEPNFDAVIQRVTTPALRRRDVYLEVANVAIGRAADSLARHFDVFVNLPLPNVNVFEVSELHMTMRHLATSSTMSGVCQGFSGEGIAGEALVLLSDASVHDLVGLMNYPTVEGSDTELELLMDVSNILVGSFLKGLGQQAEVKFFQSHPVVLGQHTPIENMIEKTEGNWRRTMTFEVSYGIEGTEIKCDLLLMFVDESLPLLDNKLAYLMDGD
ncbi:chemotaxis protein CheC, partial [Photobacterium sanctipauli]